MYLGGHQIFVDIQDNSFNKKWIKDMIHPHDAGAKARGFDLHRFDETFFQRLHDRARALQDHGIYLSVMLFELYGFLDGEAVDGQRLWDGNVFNGANNVSGLDVDRNQNRLGEEFFSLDDPSVPDRYGVDMHNVRKEIRIR